MKKLAENILIDWKKGKVNFNEIIQYLKLEAGEESTQKVLKALDKLLIPTILSRYGNVTESSVGIRYYNQLQETIPLYGDKINRKSAEQAYLESERMKVEWLLKTVPNELRKSLLIWKEYLAEKEPYSHRVNAMSRYYFPSSKPKGKPPRKGDGEYDEYNEFLQNRHGRRGEKDQEGKTVIKGISYKPFLKAYIAVIDLLETPEEKIKAVLDALQMIIYYGQDPDNSVYLKWKELEAGEKVLPKAIEVVRRKLNDY